MFHFTGEGPALELVSGNGQWGSAGSQGGVQRGWGEEPESATFYLSRYFIPGADLLGRPHPLAGLEANNGPDITSLRPFFFFFLRRFVALFVQRLTRCQTRLAFSSDSSFTFPPPVGHTGPELGDGNWSPPLSLEKGVRRPPLCLPRSINPRQLVKSPKTGAAGLFVVVFMVPVN